MENQLKESMKWQDGLIQHYGEYRTRSLILEPVFRRKRCI